MVLERGYDIVDVERLLPGTYNEGIAEMVQDPTQRQVLLETMGKMRGGGAFTEGQGPGPVDPQAFAASPETSARQGEAAARSEAT